MNQQWFHRKGGGLKEISTILYLIEFLSLLNSMLKLNGKGEEALRRSNSYHFISLLCIMHAYFYYSQFN